MSVPAPQDFLELLKPVTWFAPMWAFMCGAVSSGQAFAGQGLAVAAGIVLSGPLLCASSQAVNDWQDRDVDAINQPDRPIPSGRITPNQGAAIAIAWTLLSAFVAALLGPLGIRGGGAGPAAVLGVQHAAGAPQTQRLVGQRRGRAEL